MKHLRLGDLVSLQRGTTYQSALLGLPGPVLLGLASIAPEGGFRRDSLRTYGGESQDKLLARPGELFVSLKDVTQSGNLLGSIARVPAEVPLGRLTQDTVKLVPLRQFDAAYLYWALRAPEYRQYCRSRAIGTTNLSLSREDFLSFSIPEPNAAHRRLVSILEATEAKIELNRRTNETLEAMARALFKSWFVDFDPVRAKMEGRAPAGMDAATAALFPSHMDPTTGHPSGWSATKLSDAGAWVSGGTPARSNPSYWHGTIPWLSAKSMGPFCLIDAEEHVTDEGAQNGTRLIPPGAIVFVVRGMSLASEFRVGVTCRRMTINQDMKAIVDSGRVHPMLIAWFLRESTELILGLADEAGHGTKRLATDRLETLEIVAPARKEQDRLAAPLLHLFERMAAAERESRTLAALRDALLPRLLSGELRVRDAERLAERAL